MLKLNKSQSAHGCDTGICWASGTGSGLFFNLEASWLVVATTDSHIHVDPGFPKGTANHWFYSSFSPEKEVVWAPFSLSNLNKSRFLHLGQKLQGRGGFLELTLCTCWFG